MEKSNNSPKCQKQTIPMEGITRFPDRLNIAMQGMTNVELASKTGLTEATIRNYRKGKSYPPLDKLKELADACNSPLEWLATGINIESKSQCVEIDFESEIRELAVWLSIEEKLALIGFIRREGVNSLLKLITSSHVSPPGEQLDEMLDKLPLRATLKQAIKLALAGDESLDQEILRRIEEKKNTDETGQLNQEGDHQKVG